MTDTETERIFAVDVAKQGRAACKKCKQKCEQSQLRLAKISPSPYGAGSMKNWHHVDCFFEASLNQRPTTKRLRNPAEDLDGWDDLDDDNRAVIVDKINECENTFATKHKIPFQKISLSKLTTKPCKSPPKLQNGKVTAVKSNERASATTSTFREFRKVVADITNVSAYGNKTQIVHEKFSSPDFRGDIALWCKLLLPGVVKRIYNVKSKQLVKLFSRIFDTSQADMLEHLEQGDVSETVKLYYEKSKLIQAPKSSNLTIQDVDNFLEKLSTLTKEQEQETHLKKLVKNCTGNDLLYVIRLIKHDLRMNAGAKHILDGVHPNAYEVYQSCRDLKIVLEKCSSMNTDVKASIYVMTPVLPMLAEACKSVEQAMKKCPNGMYSEIKYDGERLQLHKQADDFKYFSRSLKPVMAHKVAHFQDFIPKAFPHGKDMILDCEILMVDTKTGKPLPFGTLGAHKKNKFQDASVCLFVFDCIFYNGQILTHKSLNERKTILRENMTEIRDHVMFSEMEEIHQARDLRAMIAKVLKLGLEGLVLKDINSVYEPGKRHWLKVKKDYLFDGAMADSADLIVLGAWFGTGKKGGMMSVFLMGCYDKYTSKFKTVTKVHTGHDDETLSRLQSELEMVKISCDYDRVPDWLDCTRTMVPDFVAKDPRKQPVWEITGAEFSQVYEVHTADGISIRFPRVTKIRSDKSWDTATNLQELKTLFRNSKNTDVSLLLKDANETDEIPSKASSSKATKRMSPSQESPQRIKKAKLEVKNIRVIKIENPLPDYFMNVKLLVDGLLDSFGDWIRYFQAYGGNLVPENKCDDANYVLHQDSVVDDMFKVKCSKSAKHVTIDWIRDSVHNKKLMDWKDYAVTYLSPKPVCNKGM